MRRKTHEEFLLELKSKNKKVFNTCKILTEYNGADNNIFLLTKYGECCMSPNRLLAGRVPSIKSAVNKTEYWINSAKDIHGEQYDYSESKYTLSINKIKIICKKHGAFNQIAGSHLLGNGCPKCANEYIGLSNSKSEKYYMDGFKDVHGNRYGYDNIKFTNGTTKVSITCYIHGDFLQKPTEHLCGAGCPMCAKETSAYSKSRWTNAHNSSRQFDSYKLYIIKCWNEFEVFYKIGITFRKLNVRFNNANMPYFYEVIDLIESNDGEYVWNLEKELHKNNRANKYIPKKYFCGINECFSELV